MADDTIGITEPASPNKKLQSYLNTVSGNSVEAEATVQVDLTGVPVPRGTSGDPKFVTHTGLAADNTANSTTKLPVMAGVANTFAPNYTSGNMVPLSLNTGGALRVALSSITANQGTPNAGGGQAWPVILSGGAATGVTGISAVDNTTTAQTVLNSFNAGTNLESLFVEPLGSQNLQFQQEATTAELQVVLHIGTTGIDPRQIRALASTDKPDITANQSGTLKVAQQGTITANSVLTDPGVNTQQANVDSQGRLQVTDLENIVPLWSPLNMWSNSAWSY